LRVKSKKFLGMPIPDRQLSREEAENLTEADLKEMGFDTKFWPFYLRVAGSLAKVLLLLLSASVALGYGTSFLSGTDYEIAPLLRKVLPLIGVVLAAPIIVIAVSYLWWYGSKAFDKLFGKNE